MILFALSWAAIDPLFYGLRCNVFTKKCDSKNIYSNGRYFIGPFSYFIEFPANYKTIEFSDQKKASSGPLKTRTLEGLALGLHITF